jgi:membrane protease YdiL (CAAX protease family)
MHHALRAAASGRRSGAPPSHTALAFGAGSASIALSLALMPLADRPLLAVLVRDVAQVGLLGIVLPLLFVLRTRASIADFGFTLRRAWPFLATNFALGAALLWLQLRTSPPPAGFQWHADNLWRAGYVAVSLVFELVFFYGFLRTLFERAFGALAGIVLAALFYSFHHAGFQPEFVKLFFVGVLYATVFRIGNSALLIFPFFLGVGGIYDVLLKSKVVAVIEYPEWRTIGLALWMASAFAWFGYRRNAIDAQASDTA